MAARQMTMKRGSHFLLTINVVPHASRAIPIPVAKVNCGCRILISSSISKRASIKGVEIRTSKKLILSQMLYAHERAKTPRTIKIKPTTMDIGGFRT